MYRLSVIQKPFLPLVFFALVCIPSLLAQAPPNDDCSGAITLIPILSNNCTTPTNGTTVGATPSGVPNDCVFGNPNDDVWYKFTATDTEHTITLDCSVGFDGVMDIRSGSCNGPNIKCVDGGLEGVTEMVTLSNLSIGTMYFIRVYEYYTDVYGPFSICVTATPTVIERDLSVSQILLPQSGCANSALQSIRVRITNNGTLPQSGFTVQYTVNGAPVNETVFATVPAGGTIDYTFSQQANMPVSGNSYTIQARTLLPNDQNPANDATSATYSNMPAFDAGVSGATSVCQGIGTYIFLLSEVQCSVCMEQQPRYRFIRLCKSCHLHTISGNRYQQFWLCGCGYCRCERATVAFHANNFIFRFGAAILPGRRKRHAHLQYKYRHCVEHR
ncbi:MAG: CARDB domain-containing protein [Saprospiraceae bacterium]